MSATAKPKLYRPRHPERTLLYQTVAEHYETWLELACSGQFDGQGGYRTPKPYVRQAVRKYLECGIFAHGFARAWCGPGAAQVDNAALHIGAMAFIHRFGSSLNGHVHFHVSAVDGVFQKVADEGESDAQSPTPRIVFHPASAIDAGAAAQAQGTLRRRILRAFVGRGLLESFEAKEMLG